MTTATLYPRLGTTYPAEGGGTITAAGLSVPMPLSNYYAQAYMGGFLVSPDPTGAPPAVPGFVPSSSDVTTLNVRSYGARGDGVTDDTAAIQAAINACQLVAGRSVYLPGGTASYKVTGLNITGACRIWGDGSDTSILSGVTGSETLLTVTAAGSQSYRVAICGLAFKSAANGVKLTGAGYLGAGDLVYDCDFTVTGKGLWVNVIALGSSYRNLRFFSGQYGVFSDGPLFCQYASFDKLNIQNTTIAAMYFADHVAVGNAGSGQQGIRIYDVIFDANTGHGLWLYASSASLYNCYFEATGGDDVRVESNYVMAGGYVPTYAKLINPVFDGPGLAQLVSGSYGTVGSVYKRMSIANQYGELIVHNPRLLQQGYVQRIDISGAGSTAFVECDTSETSSSGFTIYSSVSNYMPFARSRSAGAYVAGSLTTFNVPTSLGIRANVDSYGGGILAICSQTNGGSTTCGLYLIRLANFTGTGFLATLVSGDAIAAFSIVGSGLDATVYAVASNAATMQVSLFSSHV